MIDDTNLDPLVDEIEGYIKDRSNGMAEMTDSKVKDLIDGWILEYGKTRFLSLKEKLRLKHLTFHRLRGYDCLEELMEDEEITEIMVNAYDDIFVERGKGMEHVNLRFGSRGHYRDMIQRIVASCNRVVNESSPIVDARLPDGSRVNAVLPPVSAGGEVLTIRRFPKHPYTMEDLLAKGMLSREMADFLSELVKSRYSMVISGGTATGKTTFLNALSQWIPSEERIISIEDSCELQLLGLPNLVRLEARSANGAGNLAVTIRDLIRTALRMRPSRILVGEVRGAEAVDMIQAMNTGHDGSLSTAHANSARDLCYRLETMILMGMEIPLAAIRQQIASAVEIVIQIGRGPDGVRRITEIAETDGLEEGEIKLHYLYRYGETGWKKEGEILHDGKLKAYKKVWENMGKEDDTGTGACIDGGNPRSDLSRMAVL